MTQTHCVTQPTRRKAVSSLLFFCCAHRFLKPFSASEAGVFCFSFFFLELLYCVSQSLSDSIAVDVSKQNSCCKDLNLRWAASAGDGQHAQETDLITGWTANKRLQDQARGTWRSILVWFLRLDVRVIPVVGKALCSGVSWRSFHSKEKGLAGWGSPEPLESRAPGV